MSSFPQSEPTARRPRPRFDLGFSQGPTVGLTGVETAAPVVAEDPGAKQLAGVMRQLEQTAGTLADSRIRADNQAERQAARQQQDANRQEAEDEKQRRIIENGWKRTGATSALEFLPGFENDIKNGAIAPTEQDQYDPELFIERVIRENTAGMPESYRDAFAPAVMRRGLAALYAKSNADRERKAKLAAKGTVDRVLTADDPSSIPSILDSGLQDGTMTPEQVDSVATTALVTFARSGNAGGMEAVKTWLGEGREQRAQMLADDLYESWQSKDQSRRHAEFLDAVATAKGDVAERGGGIGDAINRIKMAATDLNMPPRYVQDHINALVSEQDAMAERQQKQAAVERTATQLAANLSAGARRYVDAARQGVSVIDPARFEAVPGLPESMGGVAAQREAVLMGIRRESGVDLDGDFNNATPQGAANLAALQTYVKAIGNVFGNTAAQDPQLAGRLTSIDTTVENAQEGGRPRAANLRNAIVFDAVRTINPAYADAVIGNSPTARAFYENVTARMNAGKESLEQAVVNATRHARNVALGNATPMPSTAETYEAMRAAFPNGNAGLWRDGVRQLRVLMSDETIDPKVAAAKVADDLRSRTVPLHDAWYFRSKNRLQVDLGPLAAFTGNDEERRRDMATAFTSIVHDRLDAAKKKNPTLDVDESDLTVVRANGEWQIAGHGVSLSISDLEMDRRLTAQQVLDRAAVIGNAREKEKSLPSEAELVRRIAEREASIKGKPRVADLPGSFGIDPDLGARVVVDKLKRDLESRRWIDWLKAKKAKEATP